LIVSSSSFSPHSIILGLYLHLFHLCTFAFRQPNFTHQTELNWAYARNEVEVRVVFRGFAATILARTAECVPKACSLEPTVGLGHTKQQLQLHVTF